MSQEGVKPEDMVIIEGGEEISLADLAGVDLEGIAEQRFSSLPRGVYVLEVSSEKPPHFGTIENKEGKKKAAAIFTQTVLDVLALADNNDAPEGDPTKLIGREHRETFFVSDQKSIGYIKAFVKDIGGQADKGPLGGVAGKPGILDACAGIRFQAPIGHRKDPNDADKIYVNIVRNKIKPLGRAEASSVAQAVA